MGTGYGDSGATACPVRPSEVRPGRFLCPWPLLTCCSIETWPSTFKQLNSRADGDFSRSDRSGACINAFLPLLTSSKGSLLMDSSSKDLSSTVVSPLSPGESLAFSMAFGGRPITNGYVSSVFGSVSSNLMQLGLLALPSSKTTSHDSKTWPLGLCTQI